VTASRFEVGVKCFAVGVLCFAMNKQGLGIARRKFSNSPESPGTPFGQRALVSDFRFHFASPIPVEVTCYKHKG